MEREYRGVPFERYADDIVVHCSRMSDATRLKNRLSERFSEVGLVLNAGKTNIAYIDTFKRRNVATSFTFLGYDFKVRTLKNFKGELYRKCMPGASNAAMRKITETIKKWRNIAQQLRVCWICEALQCDSERLDRVLRKVLVQKFQLSTVECNAVTSAQVDAV
ncbi:reverse transcriptase [Escherichia coli]|uniref:Reverse transcriptase n=1 Tax=Escherichia coli TaxID=562 RepID=A0A376W8D1_ECOLX|nr:reverse transcriptase [Escherichia coli]